MVTGCPTVIALLLFGYALAHSQMSWPEPMSSQTCRMGGEPRIGVEKCSGPCDLRAIKEGKANFDSPANPAATFRRGQTYTIKYQRNNHPPGGFVRLTMVTPDKMMDKTEHAKNAFYYSCWGANAVKAGPGELEMQQYGFTMVGTDAQQHDLAPGYYTTDVKIPAVIPDGDYVLGWAWYGGIGPGKVENNGPATIEPEPWGYFSDYWTCSYVKVEGGAPLVQEHTPVFVNDMSQFSSEGCMSANDGLGVCTYEPCRPVTGKYQKPREFKDGKTPRPLTPANFGGVSSKSLDTVEPTTQPPSVTPAPMPSPEDESGPDLSLEDKILIGRRSCRCIAAGESCWETLAERTKYCKPFTSSFDQPSMCKEMCCSHCENRRKARVCLGETVALVCYT